MKKIIMLGLILATVAFIAVGCSTTENNTTLSSSAAQTMKSNSTVTNKKAVIVKHRSTPLGNNKPMKFKVRKVKVQKANQDAVMNSSNKVKK